MGMLGAAEANIPSKSVSDRMDLGTVGCTTGEALTEEAEVGTVAAETATAAAGVDAAAGAVGRGEFAG